MKQAIEAARQNIAYADQLETTVIEVKLQSFVAMVYGCTIRDLPDSQAREIRSAFFAGAAMYQGDILGLMGAEPGDLTEDQMAELEAYSARIADELEDFSQAMVNEHNERLTGGPIQ